METSNKKIIRAVTVSMSVDFFKPLIPDLQKKGYVVVSLSSDGPELEELRQIPGCRVLTVEMERHISLTKDLKALMKLIKVFRKEQPYMVHSMTPKAGLLCMVAAWICRVPRRVHTFTGLVWPTSTGLTRKILMLTDKLTCMCATHVIPEGQGVLNDIRNGHITKKPMKVLGYGNVRGIDMTRFSRRPEIVEKAAALRKDDYFTFLYVGRIVRDKGINELVEAFCRLLDKYKVRLILVGHYENNLDPISKLSQDKIKTTTSIIEVGPVWGDDILKYYAASDCFVFPSYREGFPNTVLEAGAMGLPSIVTDINGSREIITTGFKIKKEKTNYTSAPLDAVASDTNFGLKSSSKIDSLSTNSLSDEARVKNNSLKVCDNGIIIPSKNVEALYEAMKIILENKEVKEKMGKNARPMIENRFEQGFVRKCLYDFYDEII